MKRWNRWARANFRVLAGIALLLGLVIELVANRAAVIAVDWTIEPVTLAGAVGLLALAPLAQALTLRVALRRLGARAPWCASLQVWARSFALRYEPTGTVGFAYRVRERGRLGASTAQMLTASGYEQLAALTAGALVALAAFLGAGMRPPALACLLAAGLGAAALGLRRCLLADRLARWAVRRGVALAGPLPGRTLGAMVALDALGWATTGLGAWLLADGLLGAIAPLVLLAAFALSWVIGVLTPLLPGGLGPRDAALAVALAPILGPGRAAVLALGLRVVSFAAELLAVLLAEAGAFVLVRRHRDVRAPQPQDFPARGGTARAIVVVPTYNEREALPLIVDRCAADAPGFELLVVDDSSPDGTGELADVLAATRPWMHVLHRGEKDGLGMAYRAGFGWCLERGYEVIGQMDCDLSHPPERLAEMHAVLRQRDADLVLGSRYLAGGSTAGWSATRRTLSRIGCQASRLALGLPFSDLSGGFKLWRADCLRAIELDRMLSAGYAFQVEATQLAFLAGARIEEIPFTFAERIAGTSKMSLRISLEGIRVTLALRRRRRASSARGWRATPGTRQSG